MVKIITFFYTGNDDQVVSCHYEYCHILVHKLELIDNLYCSSTCKKLDLNKEVVHDESPSIQETTFSSSPKIDRKQILTKIGNKIIDKRKQLLTAPCSENKTVNDGWDEPLFDSSCSEPPNDDVLSPKNVDMDEIDEDEDEDGDIVFDLEVSYVVSRIWR